MVDNFWQSKKVLVTGHTGFKGSWLSLWLLNLGAEVIGLSLEPNTNPSLFEQLQLEQDLNHNIVDIRNSQLVGSLIASFKPDIVFHLAAQPLVRKSYVESVETWNTNVMGTIHVLEAMKGLEKPSALVAITTDKCYENREWLYGYRENDPLGGNDPYSSSKAAAEIAIRSWRNSFFANSNIPIGIASARAGNVIGGGDWAEDRILPDTIRALINNQPIQVRNPKSTRPWQHVLEPLSGYLELGKAIYENSIQRDLNSAFNFGPALESNKSVQSLVELALKYWPGEWLDCSDPQAAHEAKLLNLVTDKAYHLLGWQPVWDFQKTVQETIQWYRDASEIEHRDYVKFKDLTSGQITSYENDKLQQKSKNI
jgi:CDP-glucose 4,6-dehydratase